VSDEDKGRPESIRAAIYRLLSGGNTMSSVELRSAIPWCKEAVGAAIKEMVSSGELVRVAGSYALSKLYEDDIPTNPSAEEQKQILGRVFKVWKQSWLVTGGRKHVFRGGQQLGVEATITILPKPRFGFTAKVEMVVNNPDLIGVLRSMSTALETLPTLFDVPHMPSPEKLMQNLLTTVKAETGEELTPERLVRFLSLAKTEGSDR